MNNHPKTHKNLLFSTHGLHLELTILSPGEVAVNDRSLVNDNLPSFQTYIYMSTEEEKILLCGVAI